MRTTRKATVDITLDYTAGVDEPQRGIFRRRPVQPELDSGLAIAIRKLDEPGDLEGNPYQLQVHLLGTAAALEKLGTYLIALARLQSDDPEPYGSFDEVQNADGGTIRLLPRRVQTTALKYAGGPSVAISEPHPVVMVSFRTGPP